MQTVFDRTELAERWGMSCNSVRRLELDGKLHRLPDLPGVKYSAAEIYQLENIGKDAQAMSPWERKLMAEEIAGLKEQVKDLTERLVKVQQICRGVL